MEPDGAGERTRGRRRRLAFVLLLVGLGAAAAGGIVFRRGRGDLVVRASAPAYAPGPLPPGVDEAIEVVRAGARIRAWVLEPEGAPRGTLFLLHGIHDRKAGLVSPGRRHAARGLRAVLVDSRGHGESSGRHVTFGVEESRDLAALADALAARGLLAPPVIPIGTSLGGATAILWAAGDDRVGGAVALAPFASLRAVVPRYVRRALGPLADLVPRTRIDHTVDDAGRVAGFDPDAACPVCVAPQLRVPLLLVHGTADDRIPSDASRRIAGAAPTGLAELMLVDGADHGGLGAAPEVARRIDAFVADLARESPAP